MAKDKKGESSDLRSKLKNQIMEFFAIEQSKAYNYKQVSKRLEIADETGRKHVMSVINELLGQGQLKEVAAGKYRIHPKVAEKLTKKPVDVIGVIQITSTGRGFVANDLFDEDIKINAANINHALNGDTVKVALYAKRVGRQIEGEISEVLSRAKDKYIGTVEVTGNTAFLIANDSNLGADIFIPLSALKGAKNGQKAVVRITEWPINAKSPVGEIIEVLGNPGEHQVEMSSIIMEYELPTVFPKEVENAANKIPLEITKEEIKKRFDFRKVLTFTIDPFDAKDFDDAISFKVLTNGNYEVGVHIADVSHYVKIDDVIDKEAQDRGTSVYLVDRVIPMLPEHLSNGVCSLRPNEEKLCFAAVFELTPEAKIEKEWFGRTVINSNRRFTYEEVQEIIEKKEGEYCDEILILDTLAKKLRTQRKSDGAFNFNKIEVKFDLDDAGKPIGVFFKVQKDAHRLIEDFMLLANRRVAEHVGKPDKGKKVYPTVYRIHDAPDPEKLAEFSKFVHKLGYKVSIGSRKSTVESMNKLLTDIDGKGEQNLIESLAIRSMAKAVYSTKNLGHYGLAFDFYVHFTSPIRRYPDLMVHRLLENFLNTEKPYLKEEALELVAKHSSKMETRAAEAERASVKYKQVEFLADKIGKTFEGYISGVTKWGLFIEIIENKCEGMVRITDIHDDYYVFDEENYQIVGNRYKRKYRLGDKVQIRVKRADLVKKQLDFELIEAEW